MVMTAAEVFRDYAISNMPASGVNKPEKRDARAWGTWLETQLSFVGAAGTWKATYVALQADLAYADGAAGFVYADPNPAYNGQWRKNSASGFGYWTRIGDLPGSVIRLTVTGGTPNAIVASAPGTPLIPANKLYLLTPDEANTSATTLAVNGAAPLSIKNALGGNLAANSLLPNSPVLLARQGNTYQLMMSANVDASAVLADAQAAALDAEASAVAAAGAVPVAGFGAMAGLNTALRKAAVVYGNGWRNGLFLWDPSDLSAYVAVDSVMGIYVPPTSDTTGASGAWVRYEQGTWHDGWFGVPVNNPANDCRPALAVMINLFNLRADVACIQWRPAAYYLLSARLPTFTRQVHTRAARSGAQMTLWVKNFVESSPTIGIFSHTNYGFVHEDLQIVALGGSGGSGISVITTGTTVSAANSGDRFLVRPRISCGTALNHSAYFDGSSNVDPGGPGLRVVQMPECGFFGAAISAVTTNCVHHLFSNGFVTSVGGAPGSKAWVITGNDPITGYCNDFTYSGIIGGPMTLDFLTESYFTLNDFPAIENTGTVSGVTIAGIYNDASLQHNWDENSCRYAVGIKYREFAQGYLANTATDVTGDGTEATVIFDTLLAATTGSLYRAGSLNYNVANGRYTAQANGLHHFDAAISLLGVTSDHDDFTVTVHMYSAGGSENFSGIRTWTGHAKNQANLNGQLTIPLSFDLLMSVGDYMLIKIAVSKTAGGGAKVVDIRGSTVSQRWTRLTGYLVE